MKFSIKKLIKINESKENQEEKVELKKEKIYKKNKTNFLESNKDANMTFVGITEFDEIIDQIEKLKLGPQYGDGMVKYNYFYKTNNGETFLGSSYGDEPNFFGKKSIFTLADGREIDVSSAFNKERNYVITQNSIHTYVSMDFCDKGYASGMDFDLMGFESEFIKGNEKAISYITHVSWPRYHFQKNYNYYVGNKWLGKSFPVGEDSKGKISYDEFLILNHLPIGNNKFVNNGKIYILKYNNLNYVNPLKIANNQACFDFDKIEMYFMEDNGQFNNKSTLEEVEKTFEMLKNEKESKTLTEEKQQ